MARKRTYDECCAPTTLGRRAALTQIWNESHLGCHGVFCAMAVVERTGGFPVDFERLEAAAFIGHKAHGTLPYEKWRDFRDHVLHGWNVEGSLKTSEMKVLQALHFNVPMHVRVDDVAAFADGKGVPDSSLQQCMALSLLLPSFQAMSVAQYVRCVLFAAAHRSSVGVTGLVGEGVTFDYIEEHGVLLANSAA
jgi:hypothetical protein